MTRYILSTFKSYTIKHSSYETQALDELTADDDSSCLYDVRAHLMSSRLSLCERLTGSTS